MSEPIHRLLETHEYPDAVRLWVQVFNVEATFFETLISAGENISVGTLVDGQIVSSVHVFIRWVRDLEGLPRKMGGIGSVSTHPDHRKLGYSGRLLEMALEAMEKAGCEWSYLGTGVNDHYARYGWRTFSTQSWKLALPEEIPEVHTVRKLTTEEADLSEMARVFASSRADTPMAFLRTSENWHSAIRYRLKGEILGYPATGPLEGYLVGRIGDGDAYVAEIAGSDTAAAALIAEFGRRTLHSGRSKIVFGTPVAWANLAPWPGSPIPTEGRHLMARPVGSSMSEAELFALLADPRSRHADLDSF